MAKSLPALSLTATRAGLDGKKFSCRELTQAYLDRIQESNASLHALLSVYGDEALAHADRLDRRKKFEHPLAGIPMVLKDIFLAAGTKTTAGSKILENYTATYDGTVVGKLKQQDAVLLGKSNMDEFACGSSTEHSAFGPTKNPWDLTRVPGGSSGGSAAAVAADLCAGALGSDTGGSIRYPAGFCGVVGLKTSYGRVSRSGLLSMTSSTDVIGPMAKSVSDAAVLLKAIAGPDHFDQTTYPEPPRENEYEKAIEARTDLKGLRFGVPKEWFEAGGLTAGVAKVITEAIDTVKKLGGKVIDVSLPHAKYGIPVYYVITPSEISANLARYDGIRYGYHAMGAKNLFDVYAQSRGHGLGPEAKRRIMLGTYALSHGYYDAYYLQAQKVRTIINQDFDKALKSVDAIIGPAAPHVAFKLGAQIDDPLKMYLEDIFMSPASLAGLPSLVLPAGFAKPEDGGSAMPVGLQIIGRRFDEATILAVGNVCEQATEWHKIKPKL